MVNYAEIHDNMTLYDKLRKSVPTDDDATTVARAKLADSVVYPSEGIPAIQLGQEFLRTKGGDGNSYNTGDAVNAIDWDRTTQYADSVDYVKGLIKLRKQINALRLTDYNDINANVTMLKSADGGAIQAVFKVDTAVLQADQCLGKPPFVAFLGRRPQLCRFGIADEIVTLQHVRQKAVQFADEQFGPLKDKMILPVLLSLPEHPRDNFKKFLILFKLGFDVFELFLQVFLVTETVKAVPGHPDDKQRHHRQRRINRKVSQAESRRRNPAQTRKNVGSDIHKPRNGQKHGGKKAESEHGVFLLCSNKIYFAILIAFVRHFNQIFCRRRCCRRYSQFFKIIVEI